MISFVYFDVGGVVIKDFSGTNKWNDMIADLGIGDSDIKTFKNFWKVHRREIGNGSLDLDTAVKQLKQNISIQTPEGYSMIDDFVKRFEPNPSIWPVIAHIHKTKRIGLLTDMYINMLDAIFTAGIMPNEQWDTIIDSSKVHCRKPENEIFELAKKQANVPHEEIFFIDNMEENTTAAEKLGWHTYLYDSKNPEQSSQKLLELFTKEQTLLY